MRPLTVCSCNLLTPSDGGRGQEQLSGKFQHTWSQTGSKSHATPRYTPLGLQEVGERGRHRKLRCAGALCVISARPSFLAVSGLLLFCSSTSLSFDLKIAVSETKIPTQWHRSILLALAAPSSCVLSASCVDAMGPRFETLSSAVLVRCASSSPILSEPTAPTTTPSPTSPTFAATEIPRGGRDPSRRRRLLAAAEIPRQGMSRRATRIWRHHTSKPRTSSTRASTHRLAVEGSPCPAASSHGVFVRLSRTANAFSSQLKDASGLRKSWLAGAGQFGTGLEEDGLWQGVRGMQGALTLIGQG